MADTDCASESASSICDEERVRKLFQACDADGDGYIDSQDLLAVCRELSLEDSLDELMLQLGADAQGRISYEQFLKRRLALRPEIDALKGPTLRDTASENSQGKVDSWEWDSGARDLSPVPQQLVRKVANTNFLEPMIQVLIKSDKFSDSLQKEYGHKCYVRGYGQGHIPNYGHLYTISHGGNQLERTYDEPCIGDDLPRSRSWLCCPGSQTGADTHPPPPLVSPTTVSSSEALPPAEPVTRPPAVHVCTNGCERVKQQLEEQAQRYEEQLTELHSVIAELTRKLHQQRVMAITEEDEASEIGTSAHEDSITCPLEVSELEPLENDLSDTETKLPLADSPLELPDPKLNTSQHEPNDFSTREEMDALKSEVHMLRAQLVEAQTKLAQSSTPEPLLFPKTIDTIPESPLENDEHLDNGESDAAVFLGDEKLNIKSSTIVPIHKSSSTLEKNKNNTAFSPAPVAKMAERVRLRRAAEDDRIVSSLDLVNTGLSTAVAEHLVGDILRQCDQPERQALEMELRRINAKMEHVRAQNSVLALTLSETKEHCDRLALLCGKYESNAIALRLALGISDRAIEAYDVLLALLETELTMDQNEQDTIENRAAAEGVAKQLLAHLDMHQSSDVLLSPWQHSIYPNSSTNSEPWTADHETRLREHVSRLKQERSSIQGTYVALESTHTEHTPARPASTQESRKMDLEMAVLMQELMSLREDKAELLTKLFMLEKEKGSTDLKLKYVEGQQRAQAAALKNLQGQLKDTEALLVLASQNKDQGYSDAEHAQGVELELMQALARESRLKIRLQELVSTLEQVTKNAEARLLEGRELVHDLNQTNSVLVETVDRNYRKYQSRLKKMEHQMLTLVERHTTQVDTLKQRIATLEIPVHQINSSGNSETSL